MLSKHHKTPFSSVFLQHYLNVLKHCVIMVIQDDSLDTKRRAGFGLVLAHRLWRWFSFAPALSSVFRIQ